MTIGLRRLTAQVALAVFLGVLTLPVLSPSHLRADDDIDCGSADLVLRNPTPQLGLPTPPATRQHCALCHWQRAVRSATTPAPATVMHAEGWSDASPLESLHPVAASTFDRKPARAPPSPRFS